MFVSPKPEYGPPDTGVPHLLRGLIVLVLEGRVVLMVRDDNEATLVLSGFDDARNPVNQFISQFAITSDTRNVVNYGDVRQDWYAYRIVAGVDRNDAPILVLETEKASLLAQHCSCWVAQPKLREQHVEIATTVGIHFVITVQSKTSLRPNRPSHWIVVVIRILNSETVLVDRLRIA